MPYNLQDLWNPKYQNPVEEGAMGAAELTAKNINSDYLSKMGNYQEALTNKTNFMLPYEMAGKGLENERTRVEMERQGMFDESTNAQMADTSHVKSQIDAETAQAEFKRLPVELRQKLMTQQSQDMFNLMLRSVLGNMMGRTAADTAMEVDESGKLYEHLTSTEEGLAFMQKTPQEQLQESMPKLWDMAESIGITPDFLQKYLLQQMEGYFKVTSSRDPSPKEFEVYKRMKMACEASGDPNSQACKELAAHNAWINQTKGAVTSVDPLRGETTKQPGTGGALQFDPATRTWK